MSSAGAVWRIERWLTDAEIEAVEYSRYWNDREAEREKPLDVTGGDFGAMERYLARTGLPADVEACASAGELRGTGIDLAAGNLWEIPLLLQIAPEIERIYCVEYSRHRLLELGPLVLEHYGVPAEKVVLAVGSFYDIRLADGAVDFVVMCQAFHHADRPDALLAEIRRILRPRGVVLVVGEHIVRRSRPRHLLRMPGRPLDVEPVLGDHHYTTRWYRTAFARHGFAIRSHVSNAATGYQSFVLQDD